MLKFWDKLKATFLRSLTILWGSILSFGGVIVSFAPELRQQIADAFKDNPSLVAKVALGLGIMTILVRLRGMRDQDTKPDV